MSPANSLSAEQRNDHLRAANRVRMDRSKVRLYVMNDRTRDQAVACIESPAACCHSLVVIDLLRWVPGIRTLRAMKICAKARVAERRRLGDLTDRERAALVIALRAA